MGYAGEQNVERDYTRTSIDEGHTKSQQDPADHIVPNPRGENDQADLGSEKLQLRQNSTQDGKSLGRSALEMVRSGGLDSL